MTTHVEKGIAIGIVIREAHLHSNAGVPEIQVTIDRADESVLHLLQAALGGVIVKNTWRTIGRDCKCVTNEVMKAAPPCQFMRDMNTWIGMHASYFKTKQQAKPDKTGWGWLTNTGERMF